MTTVAALQDWYLSQCNDDWEHTYGVDIGTLDNPGWSLQIDLTGTGLERKPYAAVAYGVDASSEPTSQEWLACKVEKGKFVAHGGPRKLEEMIAIFLTWAKDNG